MNATANGQACATACGKANACGKPSVRAKRREGKGSQREGKRREVRGKGREAFRVGPSHHGVGLGNARGFRDEMMTATRQGITS